MKLHQLVNQLEQLEELQNSPIEELRDAVVKIKRDCQPFLSAWGDSPMYRGMNNGSNTFGKHTVHKNRRPKDSSAFLTNAVNDALESKVGFAPRTEALFTSGSYDVASRYGDVHMIFPIGDFKFTYSPHIRDLYTAFGESELSSKFGTILWDAVFDIDTDAIDLDDPDAFQRAIQADDVSAVLRALPVDSGRQLIIDTVGADGVYLTDDIKAAIKSRNEIMVNCDEYYSVAVWKGLNDLSEIDIVADDFIQLLHD